MSDKQRILIIDDDESVRTVFSTHLSKAGYLVDIAESGRKAIEKANNQVYNLALIDIKLADMDGTELLTALRQRTPKMRKIIITGYPTLDNAIKAVNKDADGYLTKPVDLDALLAKIKEQLRKQSEDEEYGQAKVADYIKTRLEENPI